MDTALRLPHGAFNKVDRSSDLAFYAQPRFVTHIDDAALARLTAVYAELFSPGGRLLDLMSSWVSHLPDVAYAEVVGHGMNAAELAANPRFGRWWVQDLNADPALSLEDAGFDGAGLCAGAQYLQRPVEVFAEVRRALRPGAPFVVSFSNRCFPTKAVAIWRALPGAEQQRLIAAYMREAGFDAVEGRAAVPEEGDPLWVVVGRAPHGEGSC